MDDASVIIRRFLGSATGGQLRVGLVAVVCFLALLNSSGLPPMTSTYLIVFLSVMFAISLVAMLFLAFGRASDHANPGPSPKQSKDAMLGYEQVRDPQVPAELDERVSSGRLD